MKFFLDTGNLDEIRQAVAWGPTARAVAPEQLTRARKLAEDWNLDDEPPVSVQHHSEHA